MSQELLPLETGDVKKLVDLAKRVSTAKKPGDVVESSERVKDALESLSIFEKVKLGAAEYLFSFLITAVLLDFLLGLAAAKVTEIEFDQNILRLSFLVPTLGFFCVISTYQTSGGHSRLKHGSSQVRFFPRPWQT